MFVKVIDEIKRKNTQTIALRLMIKTLDVVSPLKLV